MNHASLIRKWPSLKEFADDIGEEVETAKGMRWRESIEGGHWAAVVTGAKRRGIEGVTLEALAEGAPKRKKPTPHQSPARSAQGAS